MIRVIAGVVIALAGAVVLTVPTIWGVETWKWALGVLGAVLFIAGGRKRA